MNAAILNSPVKQSRLRGLGCGCGCQKCNEAKPLAGTLDFLTDTGDIAKKAVVIVALVAFAYGAYKIFTL